MTRARWALLALACAGCRTDLRFDDVAADGSARSDGAPSADATADAPAESAPRGCRVDSDCPLADLHCEPSTGACVACTTDAQCADAGLRRCDTALYACVACGADTDCGARGVCDPSSHLCVRSCSAQASTCNAPQERCDTTRGVCIDCASDADCTRQGNGARRTCQVSSGTCVQCVTSAQCGGATPECDPATFTCVACVAQANCAAGQACDPMLHACVGVDGGG